MACNDENTSQKGKLYNSKENWIDIVYNINWYNWFDKFPIEIKLSWNLCYRLKEKYVCCIILLTKLYVYTHVWREVFSGKQTCFTKLQTFNIHFLGNRLSIYFAKSTIFVMFIFFYSERIIELLNPIKISIRKWVYRKHRMLDYILSNYVWKRHNLVHHIFLYSHFLKITFTFLRPVVAWTQV